MSVMRRVGTDTADRERSDARKSIAQCLVSAWTDAETSGLLTEGGRRE
jgi:hypothetical protein